jgi:hypothetical protein
MSIFNVDKNDVAALVATLNHKYGGMRRIAAGYLIQTEIGKAELKRLFKEQPFLISGAFNLFPWGCVDKGRGKSKHVGYSQEDFLKIAIPCPICDRTPENLVWAYIDWKICTDIYIEFDGWITICDNCHLQINRFNIFHTPPHARTLEYF